MSWLIHMMKKLISDSVKFYFTSCWLYFTQDKPLQSYQHWRQKGLLQHHYIQCYIGKVQWVHTITHKLWTTRCLKLYAECIKLILYLDLWEILHFHWDSSQWGRLSTWLSHLYIVVVCCSRLAGHLPDKWSCCLPQVGSHGNKRRPVSRRLETWIPSSCWTPVRRDPHKAPSHILYIEQR